MPFFTEIDPRAEVTGSRDPLGFVPLWSRLGRRFVGNVTTASGSARGFSTLLIGYYLAEALDEKDGPSPLDVFLRFEQVAAYTRLIMNEDSRFRGERRARRERDRTSSPRIGVSAEGQILSDQKTYGLWGLYSTAARSSGLLRYGEPLLTPTGRDSVERLYMSKLRSGGAKQENQLKQLVRKDGRYHTGGVHADLAKSLSIVLRRKFSETERETFNRYVVDGGPDDRTGGDQPRLAALLRTLPADEPFGFKQLARIIAAAVRARGHEALAQHLQDTLYVEHAIVPLQAAFLFALSRDGQPLNKIVTDIRNAWGELGWVNADGIARVRPEIEAAFGSQAAADRLLEAAHALTDGDYNTVLRAMIDHNEFVMRERNGSECWARLDGTKLRVRYRDETDSLPRRSDMKTLWRSTYFIDPLKAIINEVDLR